YLLIGIEYFILCIITPIIELIVIVFKTSEEKCYNFFTAEIYRYIIAAQSLCITLPLIAFLILLVLKLDGVSMLWHFVFLPFWILIGLVIVPCCCFFSSMFYFFSDAD